MSVQIFTSICMLLLTYFSLDKNGGPADVTITGVIITRLKTTCRCVFYGGRCIAVNPEKKWNAVCFPIPLNNIIYFT